MWSTLSGVWRLLETTSIIQKWSVEVASHKWSVEVTQIEIKNEWIVEVFECFLRFGATVWHNSLRFPKRDFFSSSRDSFSHFLSVLDLPFLDFDLFHRDFPTPKFVEATEAKI